MQIVRTNEAILSSLKQGVAAAALVQKPQRILHGRLKKISQYKKQEGHADEVINGIRIFKYIFSQV